LKDDLKDLWNKRTMVVSVGAGVAALVFNSIRDGATVYYFKYFIIEENITTASFLGISFVLSGLYLAVGQLLISVELS
jgi:GPH family glycoside/pentoside/hexuronide:cation symporter